MKNANELGLFCRDMLFFYLVKIYRISNDSKKTSPNIY